MYTKIDNYIYKKEGNDLSGKLELIGMEYKTENIYDEQENIIGTKQYKFNMETGQYEAL